mmetsp:Transcript_18458/g.39335  ORF Transcript_18458/g.39335 Transcript_18458/m.39335 type:complete len:84 (+) Transcript_18458:96-347(+)
MSLRWRTFCNLDNHVKLRHIIRSTMFPRRKIVIRVEQLLVEDCSQQEYQCIYGSHIRHVKTNYPPPLILPHSPRAREIIHRAA